METEHTKSSDSIQCTIGKKDENSGIEPLELGQKKHPSIPNNQQKGQLKC